MISNLNHSEHIQTIVKFSDTINYYLKNEHINFIIFFLKNIAILCMTNYSPIAKNAVPTALSTEYFGFEKCIFMHGASMCSDR